jgi:thymidylate synthase
MRFEGPTFAATYNQALAWLKDAPECSPRGMKTKEMLGCQLFVEDARSRLAFCSGRKFSLAFALAEAVWVYEGRSDLEYVQRYNKRYANFSDDGVTLHGAYGPRVREPMQQALKKLRSDRDTRQAVVTIYGNDDSYVQSKDIPCTIAWQLFARDGKLNMICTMRSSDIFWGIPYDLFVNTMLQEVWADYLELDVGWYLHQSASLHVYERHYAWLDMEFADVRMPGTVNHLFMRSLSVAEKHSRVLECVDDPSNQLVHDCSSVFCYYHASKHTPPLVSRELVETAAHPGEWAAQFVRDMSAK